MKVIEKIQFESFNPESYVLADEISEMLNNKELKEVQIIVGTFKDEAYEILKKGFQNANKNGASIELVIGVDRKSISKEVLTQLLDISKSVYVYNNNSHDDFNAKIYIFKFKSTIEVLIPTTNFTLKGITTDYSNITKISFDIEKDKEQYNEFMYGIKEYIYPNLNIFQLLNSEIIEELSLKRELMAQKGKEAVLPTIDDYLKKTADMHKKINDEEVEERIKSKLNDIIQEFDIQMDDND